ncbi:MAG: D-alanyl-D-alanine carboxypeptidase, partial [Clostridiales bacterium]|nr:D-alanyl-D-alanine carboxypeptidase [Clostridiales bacterium]
MKIISLNFSTIFFHHFCLPVLYLVLFLFSTINVYGEENLDPEVNAESAILMDADTGVILYEKNKTHKTFPASITKIMTALLTLESAGNSLSDRVAFSHDAVFSLPSGSSNIAMNEGDTLSVEESLYGLLLASANEVANALAEHIGGAQEDFAVLMNQKAQDLGAVNTHFVNPSGLHDDEHYTCAYDMALFLREALKDPEFNAIIAMKHYDLPPTEKQPLSRPLNNTNKLIQPGGAFFNENVIGGKTGFTDQAQHTLATYAEKDGVRLITVVLHNEGNDHYT